MGHHVGPGGVQQEGQHQGGEQEDAGKEEQIVPGHGKNNNKSLYSYLFKVTHSSYHFLVFLRIVLY